MGAALAVPGVIKAELAQRSFAEFVRQAWHTIEPATPLQWNWHIDAICEHLEAVHSGEIKQLLVNVPPGFMKSILVSAMWGPWIWLRDPSWRALHCSHSMDLSIRDSIRARSIVTSDWYQRSFSPSWTLADDQNVKKHFSNSATGARQCVAIGGSTGFRGDATVVDDPLPADEHPSASALEGVRSWYDFQLFTRLNDMATGRRVVIMQRLHERDLSGHLLEQGGYEHLCLPLEHEPERKSVTCLWEDPRTERGELLFPEKFTPAVVASAKAKGSYFYAGQFQQNPSPTEGGIFKLWWWRFWWPKGMPEPRPVTVRLPGGEMYECPQAMLPETRHQVQSWDMAFKGKADSDFVCGQVWGKAQADAWLLDQFHERADFVRTRQAVRDMTERWPLASAKYVEDKANGPAIIAELQHEVPGLIAVNPQGGKEARAHAVAPLVEAGNVYLPHPDVCAWVSRADPRTPGLLEELTRFPKGADDRVDALTQALVKLRGDSYSLSSMVTM